MCDLSHLSHNGLLPEKPHVLLERSQGQRSSSTPGSGITGGYNGNPLAIKAVNAVFAGLSIYNAIELIVLVFITFTRYEGVFLITAHRVLGDNTVHPWFPFEVLRGHYQLGQVYKRVSAHGRVVHNGHWPERRAMKSATSARGWCGRCEDHQMDQIHDHHRRNHPSCADNCTYLQL